MRPNRFGSNACLAEGLYDCSTISLHDVRTSGRRTKGGVTPSPRGLTRDAPSRMCLTADQLLLESAVREELFELGTRANLFIVVDEAHRWGEFVQAWQRSLYSVT